MSWPMKCKEGPIRNWGQPSLKLASLHKTRLQTGPFELEAAARRLLIDIEGEIIDLIDEFSDGRIQFAFVKVKDPNTSLPKNVLIAWVRPCTTQQMQCS